MARIFLSYAREDAHRVETLYDRLSDAGFIPWMDRRNIHPGELWEDRIQEAIRESDFFMAFLSVHAIGKHGYVQRELKSALNRWEEKPREAIYLIPIRLDECEVPQELRRFQWVDLFEREEDGWTRIVNSIRAGMERQSPVMVSALPEPTPLAHSPVREHPPTEVETTAQNEARERVFRVVYMDKLSPSELQTLLDTRRAKAPFAILERSDTVDFLGPAETIEIANCPAGRVFGRDMQLHWEQASPTYQVRLTQLSDIAVPSGFSEVLMLDGPEPEPVWYYLWGEGETAVGGRLTYERAIPGQGRGQLGVAEYRDQEGQLVFYRYVELRREPNNG